MKMPISKSQRGFSLLEMLVASAIGLIAIMAMTQLFNMGMNATLTVTQRADTQENMRAGIELMTKDISMAGAGLPSGGLQLANADGSSKARLQSDRHLLRHRRHLPGQRQRRRKLYVWHLAGLW